MQFDWKNLGDTDSYQAWRETKLAAAETARDAEPVALDSFAAPGSAARDEIRLRCARDNFAIYDLGAPPGDPDSVRSDLRRFAAAFGLTIAERHRSAGAEGLVALSPSSAAGKRGYIPYSTRAMNWHTDGYYNAPQDRISGFVPHCVRPAESGGGENQLLDPEIAYIRLRDQNPDFVRALMHPAAMTIPENRESDGSVRPASVGPVFYPDPDTGRLQMRYTARTRSIAWRDDPLTAAAQAALRDTLERGDPLIVSISLSAGQGVLNNNILHNRTGFDKEAEGDSARLIYRVRFRNRVQWGT